MYCVSGLFLVLRHTTRIAGNSNVTPPPKPINDATSISAGYPKEASANVAKFSVISATVLCVTEAGLLRVRNLGGDPPHSPLSFQDIQGWALCFRYVPPQSIYVIVERTCLVGAAQETTRLPFGQSIKQLPPGS